MDTGSVTHAAIAVGAVPAWVTISPDGSKVFTLNFLSDNVSVVDTASWQLLATVPTETGSQGIIGNVTPDNAKLYVTNLGRHELIAIDTTYLLTGKLTPHGNGQLSVFDTLSGKLVGKKIALGPGPTSVVVLP
ncbi:MAG TPA: hypothetical protein VF331_15545 [Polyangiales bacterium]